MVERAHTKHSTPRSPTVWIVRNRSPAVVPPAPSFYLGSPPMPPFIRGVKVGLRSVPRHPQAPSLGYFDNPLLSPYQGGTVQAPQSRDCKRSLSTTLSYLPTREVSPSHLPLSQGTYPPSLKLSPSGERNNPLMSPYQGATR